MRTNEEAMDNVNPAPADLVEEADENVDQMEIGILEPDLGGKLGLKITKLLFKCFRDDLYESF